MTQLEKLLVIENEPNWARRFGEILRNVGESRAIEILDERELLERYPDAESFEHVGECFTDLELGEGGDGHVGDAHGLDHVLPHIRGIAPWIPIACVSRWIRGDAHIIGRLAASDFDFFTPKNVIFEGSRTDPEFNASKWADILKAMRLKRIAALSGRLLGDLETSLTAPVKIKKIGNVKDSIAQLSVTEAFFDEGLSLLGVGGSELVVNPITPGFSGINVSHLIANGHDLDEPISSHWLVKWGRPLSKVAQEAVAHRRALARGMPRNLLIPQLNPNAVCWRSIGFLVYAFEQNAETMYERLRKSKISETESFISKICDSLYATSRRKAISMREEIDKWCGSPDSTSAIDCPDNACEVTWSLIHGDLHLRNIFVHGEAPTLIDFARSDFGPVAIDCAKLTIDTLFFGLSEDDDLPNELTWQALKSSSLGLIINSFGAILRLPGDETLFVLACKHFAQRYCAYPDVPQSKKNYVSSLLKIR